MFINNTDKLKCVYGQLISLSKCKQKYTAVHKIYAKLIYQRSVLQFYPHKHWKLTIITHTQFIIKNFTVVNLINFFICEI